MRAATRYVSRGRLTVRAGRFFRETARSQKTIETPQQTRKRRGADEYEHERGQWILDEQRTQRNSLQQRTALHEPAPCRIRGERRDDDAFERLGAAERKEEPQRRHDERNERDRCERESRAVARDRDDVMIRGVLQRRFETRC